MSDAKEGKAAKRAHKATYARDKRKGGYIIRVQGPTAAAFAGRTVPVVRKDDSESDEKLVALIWSGIDDETGAPVALYSFEARPADEKPTDDLPF